MVDPNIPEEERKAASLRLKVVFVLLVAVSMSLSTVPFDPTVGQILGAFAAGLLVATALLWFVLRNIRTFYRGV